jgi:hypothetical protein
MAGPVAGHARVGEVFGQLFEAAAQALRGGDALGRRQRTALLGETLAKLASLGGGVHVSRSSVVVRPVRGGTNGAGE